MKFSIKDFFSNCEQIRSFLRIFLYFPKSSWTENLSLFQQWCDVIFYGGCLLLYKIKETTLVLMVYGKVDGLLE